MLATHRDEHAALVAMLRSTTAKWHELTLELLERGSALALWEERDRGALIADPTDASQLDSAARDIDEWQQRGWCFVSILDDVYPAQLRDIHQAPPFLFTRGTLVPDDTAISVVGSRKVSPQGLRMASSIATALAERGITVVAGLAEGVDGAAHRAALQADKRTVAFIGTGIAQSYPASHRDLQEQIACDGLVLSQFWPDAPPKPPHFIMRNASMSGYSRATIVVEAGENSGTRAQARMAVEHGRPVILTDRVAESTEWGKSLVNRPGVSVASSLDAVMRHVDDAVNQDKEIDTLLHDLAHTAL
ncbi:DNA-processing protein DprA [Phytoactinopolyspora limicola]|uniref:DNA-processing protein DprA n=1 Tax=Phytoactinopolyspora limicola TaxID=2715536 RepID=UPI001408BA80|nr:DNA-processing protein DprA [Phytoactinopolyspora limicola]